jgi:hypothetical protein
MTRSAVKRLDWSLGCGTFAQLIERDGSARLIETLWFSEREAAVVVLDNGDRAIIGWRERKPMVRVLTAEAACALAGMPAPAQIKVASSWRRVDPFHSERHRSPRFRALTTMIRHRRLACRYSLLDLAAGQDAGDWLGPCIEDPEQTAGNVAERLARDPRQPLPAALEAELLADAVAVTGAPDSARALLERAGWWPVLADLDAILQGYATVPDTTEQPRGPDPGAGDPAQLTLFAGGSR